METGNDAYTFGESRANGNLACLLILGRARVRDGQYRSLEEALAAGEFAVYETSNVNRLEVENLGAIDVLIHSGEVVRGGRQDRALAFDLIVGVGSGRVPIPAFCVESARWGRRGGESEREFSGSSPSFLPRKAALSSKVDRSQGAVWKEVAEAQAHLECALGESVVSPESPSSLHLTHEHPRMREVFEGAAGVLGPFLAAGCDGGALGVAFAVDGRWSRVEIYASPDLLRRFWPKVLNAAASEALASEGARRARRGEGGDGPVPAASADDLWRLIRETGGGQVTEECLNTRTTHVTRAGERAVLFETRDTGCGGIVVHENVLVR